MIVPVNRYVMFSSIFDGKYEVVVYVLVKSDSHINLKISSSSFPSFHVLYASSLLNSIHVMNRKF